MKNRKFSSTGSGITLNLQHKSVVMFTLSPFILGIEAFLLGVTITNGGIIRKKWLSSSDGWAPACLTTIFSLTTLFVIAFYISKTVTAFKQFRKNPLFDDPSQLYQSIDDTETSLQGESYNVLPSSDFLGQEDTPKRPLPSNHIEVDTITADKLKALHTHLDGK